MSNRRALGVRRVAYKPYIITVKTDNSGDSLDTQFRIPVISGEGDIDYNVKTSDGQTFFNNTTDLTITFPSAGTYDIEISGEFPNTGMFGSGEEDKLIDIKQWGDIEWKVMSNAFRDCDELTVISATDAPNLTLGVVKSIAFMFGSCSKLTSIDVSSWDTSLITLMNSVFTGVPLLETLDVSNWDISNVVDINTMFGSSILNPDVTNWDTSSLLDANRAFINCTNFDRDLSGWDIDQVTDFDFFMIGANGLSTANYDATLISWANQAPTSGININFGGSQYTLGGAAEAARTTLTTTYLWTITDGGGI